MGRSVETQAEPEEPKIMTPQTANRGMTMLPENKNAVIYEGGGAVVGGSVKFGKRTQGFLLKSRVLNFLPFYNLSSRNHQAVRNRKHCYFI
jgi:hypothetical protein